MNDNLKQFSASQFLASAALLEKMGTETASAVAQAGERLAACLKAGNKLLVFGNGGSAADAQHLAAELVGRYRLERPSLPALALTTDTSLLTAVGNDYGFDQVFSRQVQALTQPGDFVIGISTSGRSPNVIAGLQAARQRGAYTLGLAGPEPAQMATIADEVIRVPSKETARIQEGHAVIIHILCDLVEMILFPQPEGPE